MRTHGSVVGRSVRDFAGWGGSAWYTSGQIGGNVWRVNVAACS